MVEVERKFRLRDKPSRVSIESELEKAGYLKSSRLRQADEVFLIKSDNFKTFKPGDPVARIRLVEGTATLTYKREINSDGDTIEHEMKVEPASVARELLLEIGYKTVTYVDKIRTEYSLEDIKVALDEVLGLGSFIEIEIICADGEEKDAQRKVMSVAQQLGLSDKDMEAKKYDQLISELKPKSKGDNR